MGSFTYVINKKKGDDIMSFASFVNKFSDAVNDSIRAVANSGIVGNTVGKTTRLGLNVGKAAGNLGIKVGATGINAGLEAANFFVDNQEAIVEGAKAIGKSIGKEAGEYVNAGLGAIGKFDDWFLTPTDLGRSVIGRKFNKRGLALIAVGSTAMAGGRETKQYLDNRTGSNDGQLYSSTPRMSTPYQLSQQMAYSSHGQSFADNAGATGDLVFALNNMRHG